MTQAPQRIVLLGTGGTIAGSAADPATNVGYRAGVVGIDDLVAAVAPHDVAVETEQVAQLDSKDMDDATWWRLASRVAHHAARGDVAGVVVTHGTDTLEETAWWLARTVPTTKPVVLTGAMRPATSRISDGPQNLADAFAIATTAGASGVVAVIEGTVHAARHVRKSHPYRLDAFSSGDAGPLGYVEEGVVRLLRPWPGSQAEPDVVVPDPATKAWPRVGIVSSHAGADGRIVRLLVDDGAGGIVVAATGNGNVHAALEAELADARRRGVAVLRCARGDGVVVAPREPGADSDTTESAFDLTPAKARVELLVRLLATA